MQRQPRQRKALRDMSILFFLDSLTKGLHVEKSDDFPCFFSEHKTEPQIFKAMTYLAGLGLEINLD